MAWKKWNKAPTKRPPHHKWTEEEMKMVAFVMKKGIKIAMTPDWNHEFKYWQIDININGNNHNDPSRYNDDQILEKKYEYYKYYYDKYRD